MVSRFGPPPVLVRIKGTPPNGNSYKQDTFYRDHKCWRNKEDKLRLGITSSLEDGHTILRYARRR